MKWTQEIFSTFEPDCLSVWILQIVLPVSFDLSISASFLV